MSRVPQVAQVEICTMAVVCRWWTHGGKGGMSLSGCQFGDWMSLRPVYPTHLSVVVVISQSTVYSSSMAK